MMRGMVIDMNDEQLHTLAELQAFLDGTVAVDFAMAARHLPRQRIEHTPSCTCNACGAAMVKIAEDISEVLEYVPASFKVIRHVRPKLAGQTCGSRPATQTIVQSPAPSRPIDRGLPGPGLLAHVLVSKYGDHCVLRLRPP